MVARNDITGDSIQTKHSSEQYRNNWDLIFKKNQDLDTEQKSCDNTDFSEKESE